MDGQTRGRRSGRRRPSVGSRMTPLCLLAMSSHADRLRAQIAASEERAGRREADGAQARPELPYVGHGWDEAMADDEALPSASFGGGIFGCLRGPASDRTVEQVKRERSLGASLRVLQAVAAVPDSRLMPRRQHWQHACARARSTVPMLAALAWPGALSPRWATFSAGAALPRFACRLRSCELAFSGQQATSRMVSPPTGPHMPAAAPVLTRRSSARWTRWSALTPLCAVAARRDATATGATGYGGSGELVRASGAARGIHVKPAGRSWGVPAAATPSSATAVGTATSIGQVVACPKASARDSASGDTPGIPALACTPTGEQRRHPRRHSPSLPRGEGVESRVGAR